MLRTETKAGAKKLGEAGQATVEMVLLGVIGFLVISGLIYQLHTGFRDYVDNYFGSYLVCLLETGEMPALGGPTSNTCAQAVFDLAEEGPGLEGGGGVAGSEGELSGLSGGQAGSAQSAAGSGGAAGAGANPTRSYYSQGPPGSGGAAEEAGGAVGTTRQTGAGSAEGAGLNEENTSYVTRHGQRGQGASSTAPSQRSYRTVAAQAGSGERRVRAASSGENENALRAPKLSFNPDSLKPSETPETEEEGFRFGLYLRYLVILGILILIFILVGGQALQISKSRET